MSGPLSCTSCGNPLAGASATGLCPACAPAAEPATHTYPGTPPGPDTPNAAADPTPQSAPSARPDPFAHTHTSPDAALTASSPVALPAKAPKPLPADPVGYTLLEHIGEGGMGEVYRAIEHSTDKEVALKMMNAKTSATSFARLRLEFKALSKFEHEHAVRVFKDRFDHDPPFFTMEYLKGGTVGKELDRIGRYEPRAAVVLIRKVARAVQAMHEVKDFGCPSGLVHRDIKPSNILLTKETEPKLADFGLVKFLDTATLTPTDAALGTPAYMPPEQCGSGDLDHRADVYGLGATLYHMLTGRPPFCGRSVEIIARLPTEEPPPVCELAPNVDPMLGRIVRGCMHKRSNDRYQTVTALIADLDAWLNPTPEKPPTPPEPSIGTRLGRWAKRNALALAACALLLVAGGAVALAWPRPADPLKDMQAQLGAGHEVMLIPTVGKPNWHQWVLGAPELTTSPTGDGSCSFEANGYSLLELCPDPMTDRYRIRAKIRFTEIKLRDEPAGRTIGTTSAGIYFGRASAGGNKGLIVHTLFAVTFSDELRPPPVPVPGAPPPKLPDNTVRFRGMLVHQRPEAAPSAGILGGPWGVITRPLKLPGPWREIEIEVTPERVRARCEGPDGKPGEFADLTGTAVNEFHADLRRKLDTDAPNHGAVLPEWTPRAPLGVWNLRSTIDVKDVTLTPLP